MAPIAANLAFLCGFVSVSSFPGYSNRIPNSDSVTDCDGNSWVGVGHSRAAGGGTRNAFGEDFAAAGNVWTQGLCEMDSDGDGISNGVELGDPQCVWSEGDTPQFDTGITHPGLDCTDGCNDGSEAASPTGCAAYSAPTTAFESFTFGGHAVGFGTSYVKGAFTFSSGTAAGVLRFETVNDNPSVVHHMILYRCPFDESPTYGTPTEGDTMACSEALMAWAVGGGDFCAPRDLAFVISPESNHFLLEIHYDNPSNLADIVDSSGMRLHYVEFEGSGLSQASVVLMGATLPMIQVPPGRSSYEAVVDISADMIGIPSGTPGVEIFAVIEHMHGIGRKQRTMIVDDVTGDEEELACNSAYDFDLQEAKYLPDPFQLMPGKSFRIHCTYDSTSRTTMTEGGDATEDEMCIVVVFYDGPGSDDSLLSDAVVLGDTSGADDYVCGTACGAGSGTGEGDDYNLDRGTRMLKLHGWLMIAVWGLLLPTGVMVPLCWREVLGAKWVHLHASLQLIGLVLMYVGLYAAMDAANALNMTHFDSGTANGHKLIGLFIIILASLQLLGLIRPHKAPDGESNSTLRLVWSWSHRLGGVVAIGMAIYNVATGSDQISLYTSEMESGTLIYAILCCTAVLFGAVGILLKRKLKSAGMNHRELSLGDAAKPDL